MNAAQLIASFGEDESGELYAIEFLNGVIYKVLAVAVPPTATPTLTPSPTLTPTPTPVPCAVRPRVYVQVTRTGPGTLDALITATDSASISNNAVTGLTFTSVSATDCNWQASLPAGLVTVTFEADMSASSDYWYIDGLVVTKN